MLNLSIVDAAYPQTDYFFLKMSHSDCNENIIYFTAPGYSDHIAMMNVLDDTIVIQHTVDYVETATYCITERKEALEFVESLLFITTLYSDDMITSYQ